MRLISLRRVGPQELALKPLTDLLHGLAPAPQPLSAPDGAGRGKNPRRGQPTPAPLLSGPASSGSFVFPSCLGHQTALPACLSPGSCWAGSRAEHTLLQSPGVWLVSDGPVPHQGPRLLACKNRANHLCAAGRPREYRGLCRDQRIPTGREWGPGRPTGLGLELTSLRFRPQMR